MFKTLAFAIFSILLLCALALGLMLSFSATVQAPPEITPHDISKLKKTLAKSNPFEFQRYKDQALILDEKLLNQSANFALTQLMPITASASIKLEKNRALTAISFKIHNDLHLNFSAKISPANTFIKVSDIHLGRLSIPEWLIDQLTPFVMRYTGRHYPDYMSLLDVINKIEVSKNRLAINYYWNTGLSKKLKIAGRNFLLPPDQQILLRVYYQALNRLSVLRYWQPIGLEEVIYPIFALAKLRTENGSDPVKENKAAILALGIMASGIRVNHLLQDKNTKALRNVYFFRLTLLKRRDLMQHFLISAALAVSTNKSLSDSIGLSKEIDDSKGASGFSFADLLADRAGVELAKMATRNALSAKKSQAILSQPSLQELDFMPPHKKLPESISALEFKNRYVDIHNAKYLFVEQELQRRIASRTLHK